jgi:pimaricinolide synthase PimS1
VLFSSITALIGSGGQSNYSAANAVLDAFATSEAYGGLPTASVQWGAWSDVGMAVRNEKTMRKLAQIGIIAFSPEEGLRAFTECLGSCGVQTVCAFDWYNLSCQGSNHAAYFELLQPLTGAIKQETIPDMNPFRSHVTIYEAVKSAVAEVLHCNIRDDQPLMDAGLDSLVATELAALVSRNTGIQLLSTLAFDYPTVNLIIAHVNEMIDPAHLDATEHSSLAAKLSAHSSNVHGIDIKSMAGCMPMTHMIKDCVQPISSRRWSADDEEDIRKNNGMNSRMGSTINDIEMFDSQLFGVHSIEASAIDPQQRMILVHILSMLDGICMRDRSSTGIYTGIAWTEYKDVSNIGSETMSATTASATALSVASGRVSFCFNLKGPALSVDTACSSSLVAAHLGASAICENECSTAVTCGVNLTLLAHTSAMFHRAGMLASDGRCKTLDACANGYVRA